MNSEDILEKIRKENMQPLSKKTFIFRRVFIWVLGIATTLFGAFTFAKIIASLSTTDWVYWDYTFTSFGSFAFSMLPIFWISLLLVFVILMPYLVHMTDGGYKYRTTVVVLISIIISFMLGIILLRVGATTGDGYIFTDASVQAEVRRWSLPGEGRLSGFVESYGESTLILRDFGGDLYAVDVTHVLPLSRQVLASNDIVRIIGIQTDDNLFVACQVIPFNIDNPVLIEKKQGSATIQPVISEVCAVVLK